MSPSTSGDLTGRVAVVTGAGRGLGRGAAVGLAQRGATVIGVARTRSELQKTASLAAPGVVLPAIVDLADPDAATRFMDEVFDAHGHVDVLINNAAMLRFASFEDTPPDLWRSMMAINVEAAYRLTWVTYPRMVARRRGVICNLSSGAGVRPFVAETAYAATKYAIEGFTKSLALEALEHGVVVVLATPGVRCKPCSVTEAEFLAWPADKRAACADDLDVAEAFAWLGDQTDTLLNGRRFDLHRLAQHVREHGDGLAPYAAIQVADRPT